MENVNRYFTENHIEFDESILEELSNGVPIYDEKTNRNKESIYNEVIAKKNSNIFLFDKAHLKIANRAQYEVCDLFTLNKELIQIKRYESGTASISHLFTQAKFYAEAFLLDEKIRESLKKYITSSVDIETSVNYNKDKNKFLELIPVERPTEKNYTIVLCILTLKPINIQDLPFMTQYAIFQTHKFLTVNFNYKFKLIQRTIIKKKKTE